MLHVRQVLAAQEIDVLKSALGKIISDVANKVDWNSLTAIKAVIADYKGVVLKELDKFDKENTLLQLEKDVEFVLILEQKLDKEMSEDAARIKSIKERILNRLK